MNRRRFLSSLVALPVIGSAVKALGITLLLPTENNLDKRFVPEQNQLSIFTPEEISRYWKYVDTVVFREGEGFYTVRQCKLPVRSDENFLKNYKGYQHMAKVACRTEINIIGFTHVQSVKWVTFYNPKTIKPFYIAYVYGATVK